MRHRLRLCVLALCLSALAGCAHSPALPWEKTPTDPRVHEMPVQTLETRFIIRVWMDPKDRRNPQAILAAASNELRRIALITDSDNPKSELSRLNNSAYSRAFQASPDLAGLLALSQQLHHRSGGAFDITFAPIQEVVERDGPDAGLTGVDSEYSSGVDKNVRTRVGEKTWYFDPEHHTVRFLKDGIKLVVKGLAKGFAAQKAAEKLQALKLKGFAVIAGNTFVAGGAALRDPNLMCVEDFDNPGHCAYRITPLRADQLFNLSMGFSSDRPGHLYNPKSGSRTYLNGGAAVSGPDGAWAQGAATAASIMEKQKFPGFFGNSAQPRLGALWSGESSEAPPEGSLEPYAKVTRLPH